MPLVRFFTEQIFSNTMNSMYRVESQPMSGLTSTGVDSRGSASLTYYLFCDPLTVDLLYMCELLLQVQIVR